MFLRRHILWFSLHHPFRGRLWAPPATQPANIPVAADGDVGHSQGNRYADDLGADTQPSQIGVRRLSGASDLPTNHTGTQSALIHRHPHREEVSARAVTSNTCLEARCELCHTNTVVPPTRSIAALQHPLLPQGGAQRVSSMGREVCLQPPVHPGKECRLPGS